MEYVLICEPTQVIWPLPNMEYGAQNLCADTQNLKYKYELLEKARNVNEINIRVFTGNSFPLLYLYSL